jgi:hypothetical protein
MFFLNIFLIIFVVYFLTNLILKDKIEKKTIKGPTKKNILSVGELVKSMNRVIQASTSNL